MRIRSFASIVEVQGTKLSEHSQRSNLHMFRQTLEPLAEWLTGTRCMLVLKCPLCTTQRHSTGHKLYAQSSSIISLYFRPLHDFAL